jgi:hypothetical protein
MAQMKIVPHPTPAHLLSLRAITDPYASHGLHADPEAGLASGCGPLIPARVLARVVINRRG